MGLSTLQESIELANWLRSRGHKDMAKLSHQFTADLNAYLSEEDYVVSDKFIPYPEAKGATEVLKKLSGMGWRHIPLTKIKNFHAELEQAVMDSFFEDCIPDYKINDETCNFFKDAIEDLEDVDYTYDDESQCNKDREAEYNIYKQAREILVKEKFLMPGFKRSGFISIPICGQDEIFLMGGKLDGEDNYKAALVLNKCHKLLFNTLSNIKDVIENWLSFPCSWSEQYLTIEIEFNCEDKEVPEQMAKALMELYFTLKPHIEDYLQV